MKCLDPGHHYILNHLDGDSVEELRFVKREGPEYPGNIGHYAGTNLQEVIRVLIDRVKYLDNQIQCYENKLIISDLRDCLFQLEKRASIRHNINTICKWDDIPDNIEHMPVCTHCGHIVCKDFS